MRSINRVVWFWVAVGCICFTCISTLRADPSLRRAFFDPEAGANQYTVSFPEEMGGESILMPVVGGAFEIETDDVLGTSRLVSWEQEISPVEILGRDTGPITVTLDPDSDSDSEGTFDPATGQFQVEADFIIEFDDTELREIGFVSPVALRGTETGNFYGVGSIGTVSMFVEGEGEFAGGLFSYTCRTTARYEYVLSEDQAQPGDVNQDARIDISDPVALLGSLYLGRSVTCEKAREVNGDESVDLSDAVYILNFLYQGGPPTPATPVSCEPPGGGG